VNQPHKIYIGYDDRQNVAYTALQQSIISNTSQPVTISPLILNTLPMEARGLTPFTFSRFIVPWLCDYQGFALFIDLDILVCSDIAQLFALADPKYAVQVVKTSDPFERASMLLFNCAHPSNRQLEPEMVDKNAKTLGFHALKWLKDEEIGFLPNEWNHIVGTDKEDPNAKLIHFTQGVPAHQEVKDCEYSKQWNEYAKSAMTTRTWQELMGSSVWALELPDGKRVSKLSPEAKQFLAETQKEQRNKPSQRYQDLMKLYATMHKEGSTEQNIAAEKMFDGHSLLPHVDNIHILCQQFKPQSLLDYGAGKGTLYQESDLKTPKGNTIETIEKHWGIEKVDCYDPGYEQHNKLPTKKYDAVICTDVLEHCSLEDLPWILDEIFGLAERFVYMNIAGYPAFKKLPNGENAHITIRSKTWWQMLLTKIAQKHPTTRYFAIHESIRTINGQQQKVSAPMQG